MSMSDELDHENRIRAVEQRISEHEARCDERYKFISTTMEALDKKLVDILHVISKRFDIILIALVMLSIAMAIGPEIALKFIGMGK